jgi:hypothetical protein
VLSSALPTDYDSRLVSALTGPRTRRASKREKVEDGKKVRKAEQEDEDEERSGHRNAEKQEKD